MYESFGLIGIQLPENTRRTSTFRAKALRLVLLVFVYIVLDLLYTVIPNTMYTMNSDRRVKCKF
jgi:hypothetical protein